MSENYFHQYQIEAQPVFLEPPIVPDFGWFVQASEPVRVQTPLVSEGYVTEPTEHEDRISDFDWCHYQADVIRPKHQVRPGFYSQSLEPIIPFVPDFGWFVLPSDIIRSPHQILPGGSVESLEPIAAPPVIAEPILSVSNQTDVVRISGRMVGY